ncbi:MAG TPA: hypothetical protein VG675_15420 [Bryobacteraceae bacterium]|nr:hypothetical protein [Bryobacteraceae bacterium]
MRTSAVLALASLIPALGFSADKLSFDDRVELTRGLLAEYATARVLLPRSKKALEFNADGTYDKNQWQTVEKESGPAARSGDIVQITKIDLEDDRIVLQINGGFNGGRKWYRNIQIGNGSTMSPVARDSDSNAPGGTSIVILFHKPLEPIKAAAIKKMLSPVLDFERRSATELYSESLPPAVQQAIKDKRVTEGMNHDEVVMAMGRPQHKSRETRDGMDLEDWVYGTPPGKITFVTFNGDKVIKVKVDYAGLGTEVQDQPVPR